jgi:hypothetical protein
MESTIKLLRADSDREAATRSWKAVISLTFLAPD